MLTLVSNQELINLLITKFQTYANLCEIISDDIKCYEIIRDYTRLYEIMWNYVKISTLKLFSCITPMFNPVYNPFHLRSKVASTFNYNIT